MFEKVNPSHPDKIADRIAGALVDFVYSLDDNPKIAVEVLIGHGVCTIIAETSEHLSIVEVELIVHRIAGHCKVNYYEFPQDKFLADNQVGEMRCGDNGIFRGVPTNEEEKFLSSFARMLYARFKSDGKYIGDGESVKTICQSNASTRWLRKLFEDSNVNPLGDWTGGINVDTGATNRKLGSDMGRAVTGGGLHGKDLSKADVSVNIYAYLRAQELGEEVEYYCSIGDTEVDGKPYSEIVEIARQFIKKCGGFEKFAEWGFI